MQVGANGQGKTTLLRLIIGDLQPTKGRCHRHGRLRVGYFSQHHVDQLNLAQTGVDFLRAHFPGHPDEEYRRQLGAYGISGDHALQPIRTLSGGQKSRIVFAHISMRRPHFLLLDEPTNHLDIETVSALTEAIRTFKGGAVVVSHDRRLLRDACSELWVCEDRCVREFKGTIDDYRKRVVDDAARGN